MHRDTIVVGASAGGVEALRELAAGLPRDLAACVLVVLHLPSDGQSNLAGILTNAGRLRAVPAEDGQQLHPGRIYVAPPDHHLTIQDSRARVTRGPRENGVRPAIDPLFRSAASERGNRVIGVILSGVLDDGAAGLAAVKARGGVAMVQDPNEALFAGMPRSATEALEVDHVARVHDIARTLGELTAQELDGHGGAGMATEGGHAHGAREEHGAPSDYSCPECGGVLGHAEDGGVGHFRCRVGHAYSAEALLSHQARVLEDALWVALRTLEEQAQLAQRLGHHARNREREASARLFERRSADSRARADLIRRALESGMLTLPSLVPAADRDGDAGGDGATG